MKTLPKQILLGREHDLTPFVGTDESRYVLTGVHYDAEKQILEATDGRMLIRIPVAQSDGEFPPTTSDKRYPNPPVDCVIQSTALEKTLNNGTMNPRTTLPILQHAKLAANKDAITITTTDLDNEFAITSKPMDAKYPNTEQVVPTDEPKLTIRLNAEYLSRIADYALKHAPGGGLASILFQFTDAESPARFEITTKSGLVAKIVLMPVKMS